MHVANLERLKAKIEELKIAGASTADAMAEAMSLEIGEAQAEMERQLAALAARLDEVHARAFSGSVAEAPQTSEKFVPAGEAPRRRRQ